MNLLRVFFVGILGEGCFLLWCLFFVVLFLFWRGWVWGFLGIKEWESRAKTTSTTIEKDSVTTKTFLRQGNYT